MKAPQYRFAAGVGDTLTFAGFFGWRLGAPL